MPVKYQRTRSGKPFPSSMPHHVRRQALVIEKAIEFSYMSKAKEEALAVLERLISDRRMREVWELIGEVVPDIYSKEFFEDVVFVNSWIAGIVDFSRLRSDLKNDKDIQETLLDDARRLLRKADQAKKGALSSNAAVFEKLAESLSAAIPFMEEDRLELARPTREALGGLYSSKTTSTVRFYASALKDAGFDIESRAVHKVIAVVCSVILCDQKPINPSEVRKTLHGKT
jgi:hypothetical protein